MISHQNSFLWVAVSVLLLGLAAATAGFGSFSAAAADERDDATGFTVGPGSETTYDSIQSAIDDADAGDTIRVRKGVYQETLTIDKSVKLIAPNGATLARFDGGHAPVGIEIPAGSDAAPVISGFTVTGFTEFALRANESAGDWVFQNSTVAEIGDDGVRANHSTGDWEVRNVTVTGTEDGIEAENSTGAWAVRNSVVVRNVDDGLKAENATGEWTIDSTRVLSNGGDGLDADGVVSGDWLVTNATFRANNEQALDIMSVSGDWVIEDSVITHNRWGVAAANTTGDWTVRSTIIDNQTETGIVAVWSEGDWTVHNVSLDSNRVRGVRATETTGEWAIEASRINNSSVGVSATASTGDWTITGTEISNIRAPVMVYDAGGTGVYAHNATGDWRIHRSGFTNVAGHDIDATAATGGNATRNWWGASDGGTDCVGAVDCGEPLSSPPYRGPLGWLTDNWKLAGAGLLVAVCVPSLAYVRFKRGGS